MKKLVLSLDGRFKKEAVWVKNYLIKLDRALKLKDKYVEVYLIKDNFNVHSFPAPRNFPRPDIKGYENLGEIYLCPDYIKNNPLTTSIYEADFIMLLIHGLLHLIGYDHKKENDRMKMELKEKELFNIIR